MAVNPDASNRLKISFRQPRPGSCLTPEVLEELADLIDVQLPDDATTDAPPISKDSNNIAQLDPQNAILVPGAKLYVEEQVWQAGNPVDLEFTEFANQQIDATTCMFSCYIILDTAEAGAPVKGEPSGTVTVRPNFEVKSLAAAKIVIAMKNAQSDVTVRIHLLQLPIPPEQA